MLRELIAEAADTLARAGVSTPRVDAEELAAHLLGVSRTGLLVLDVPPGFAADYRSLVARRAERVPLQHVIGTAPFGPVTVRVGPGVFIPRPETESLFDWATRQLDDVSTIVDLCAGSGALAIALARSAPGARVIAVEIDDAALEFARNNTDGTGVEVYRADVTDPGLLRELDGAVDLLVANPPYIPEGAELEPEVAEHDPHRALFAGPDGLSVIRPLVGAAARLLRPGGVVAVEHDDTNGAQTAELFAAPGLFDEVTQRCDLAGRPRFVTARRRS